MWTKITLLLLISDLVNEDPGDDIPLLFPIQFNVILQTVDNS